MQLKRVTVTLPASLVGQLEALRHTERIAVSAVAEVALRAYLRAHADVAGDNLRAAGATLRRRQQSFSAGSAQTPIGVLEFEENP
ncbi:MAG: hypothetical protein M3Z07_00990 [Candidatus Eremiobacteraeota bacterium]|nr:hypothetical protein [Candidatus Eremiobacteraeota bacterium]